MTEVQELLDCRLSSEEHLVQVIKDLFHKQRFYVNAGNILVATNPWKLESEDLEKEIVDFINNAKIKDGNPFLPPHAFSIAENALRHARKTRTNAAIVPLGESGSGKSHKIEIIFNYFALRCTMQEQFSKETILAINSVLDVFCNAETMICNKSTRCLKLYEVFFSHTDNLIGVNLQICFLDKLRVVSQINNEGNFHIFNQFLNGLSSEQLNKYSLHGNHRYVRSNREAFAESEDKMLFAKTMQSLRKLGFVQEEIEGIFAIISAIILLGDLEFGESKKRVVPAFLNGDVLEKAAFLLGVPWSHLAGFIIPKSKSSKGNKANVSSTCAKAVYECDRLAVVLYETLVMWIESKINRKYYSRSSHFSIFLLDTFGWENYNINSFEQLCINITNETLQSNYNTIIFSQYQTELEQEGIFLDDSYKESDKPGSVPFLFKPKGLLDLLHTNTESRDKINDLSLLKKMNTAFKKEPFYVSSNQEFSGFLIQHYIGEVAYDINGFTVKSLNWLNTNALSCFKGSKNRTLSVMVQERLSGEGSTLGRTASFHRTSLKRRTTDEKQLFKTNVFLTKYEKDKKRSFPYKNSNPAILTTNLSSVLNRLSSSRVYHIRCINSNIRMEQNTFDGERVLRQVKWSGLFPTVQSRSSCLKLELTFSEFCLRYKLIYFHLSRSIVPSSELCFSALSKNYDESHFRIGKTKIFMSDSLAHDLEKRLEKMFTQVVIIQKVVRGMLGRKKFEKLKVIKNKYDGERSSFFAEISVGNSEFHGHLSLQITEDRARLKQSRLKEEQVKFDQNQTNNGSKLPCVSPDRRTSYALSNEVFTDETSELSTWCKVLCFQRTKQLAEFSLKEPEVVIDGSAHIFTTDRIGFNSFPTPSKDKQMKKVKECIGRGYFCEEKVVETFGELEKNKKTKVFEFNRFVDKVNYECNPARVALDSQDRCLAMCVVHICFVKNSDCDETCPCWMEIVLTPAVDYVQKSIYFALDKRREIQEKLHFQQPPALRIDSKMESVSLKVLKLIRPSRYIETVKFKRKGWARKRVVSNPFLYGINSPTEESSGEILQSTPESDKSDSPRMLRSLSENESMQEGQALSEEERTVPLKEYHGTVEERGAQLELEYNYDTPQYPSTSKQRTTNGIPRQPEYGTVPPFPPDYANIDPQKLYGLSVSSCGSPEVSYSENEEATYFNLPELYYGNEDQRMSYATPCRTQDVIHQLSQHHGSNNVLPEGLSVSGLLDDQHELTYVSPGLDQSEEESHSLSDQLRGQIFDSPQEHLTFDGNLSFRLSNESRFDQHFFSSSSGGITNVPKQTSLFGQNKEENFLADESPEKRNVELRQVPVSFQEESYQCYEEQSVTKSSLEENDRYQQRTQPGSSESGSSHPEIRDLSSHTSRHQLSFSRF